METRLQLLDNGGVFTTYIDDVAAGTMQFNLRNGNVMVITHTIVEPAFGGKGVGKALVKAGVVYAQEQGYKILPLCSFARAYIERKSELHTLLLHE